MITANQYPVVKVPFGRQDQAGSLIEPAGSGVFLGRAQREAGRHRRLDAGEQCAPDAAALVVRQDKELIKEGVAGLYGREANNAFPTNGDGHVPSGNHLAVDPGAELSQ
jgi:hypothetical protein